MGIRFLAVRRDQPRDAEPTGITLQAPTPFWDAVGRAARTGAEDQWRNRNGGWRAAEWQSELIKWHRETERLTGERIPLSAEMSRLEVGPEGDGWMTNVSRAIDNAVDAPARAMFQAPTIEEYDRRFAELKAKYPALAAMPTRAELWARQNAELTGVRQRASEAAADGPGGAIGGFAGGTAATMADPANLLAAAATGGAGAGRPLLMRLGAQALAGAGTEIVQAPGRAIDAERYGGPEYGLLDAAQDVGGGAAGGAGFELVGSGLAAGWRTAARRLGRSAAPVERGYADAVERLLQDEDTIGPNADDFDAARQALAEGGPRPVVEPDRDLDELFARVATPGNASQPVRAATVGNGLQPGPAGDLVPAEYRGRTIYAGRFDPLALETDAARFQYKADGDAQGVTDRLRGVERWDPIASGKIVVFEEIDGRRFVADGHQRRGLAVRLTELGFEDAQLDGYLFKAADGWTAREVRVAAALNNIRQGSGTPLDAAKLFREAPAALADRSLPITGDMVQQARSLASLSDDAFKAVVNGVVPERYAAVIGEQAANRPELHGDLVELLRKGEPRSVEGARALVQEGLLDDFIKSEGGQLDLFGGLPRESTVIARGRIREAVQSGLRADERLLASLVRNAEAIEAGGNILARSENEARLAIDRAASELVNRLALRSGEMGEAFAEAAAAVTKGELTAGKAAKGLIARIRAAVAAGERLDVERAEVLAPEAPPASAVEAAGLFDDPAATGQRGQLADKPEEAALEGEYLPPPGLWDDIKDPVHLDRAFEVLKACAPAAMKGTV